MKNILIAAAILVNLSGCGGGGAGGTSNIIGRVADGYIQGALVFWDCNGNRIPDSSELQTISKQGGAFEIHPPPSSSCILVAKVPVGAIDEDSPTTPIARPYILVSTKGNEAFISPLSTLVAAHIDQNPGSSIADAEATVASKFGISGNINSDYLAIKTGDYIVRKGLAKVAATVMQSNYDFAQPSASASRSYSVLQSLAPTIKSTDFSNNSSIATLLDPLAKFLAIPTATQFLDSGGYAVRPNSSLSLTESQFQVLDSVVASVRAMDSVVRMGVINFDNLTFNKLTDIKSKLEGAGLLASSNIPIVVSLRALRMTELQRITDYYNSISNKNQFFNTDLTANYNFWTQVAVSSVEGASGAYSAYTGLPGIDLRRYRSSPKFKEFARIAKQVKLSDLLLALLKGLNSTGKLLSAESTSKIDFLGQSYSDDSALTQEQFKAVVELTEGLIDVGKETLKNGKVLEDGVKIFGPALAIYGAATGDCTTKEFTAECFSDGLQIVELVAEWIHLDPHIKGGLLYLRTATDAYVAGKEYAKVTDKIVIENSDQFLDEWKQREDQARQYWQLQELVARGIDNLFEAYDPSVPCAANQVRQHGACVAPASVVYTNGLDSASDIRGWQFTLPWNSTYKTTDYLLQNGYLELDMLTTDKGAAVLSPQFAPSSKIRVTATIYLHPGLSVFLPNIALMDETAAPGNGGTVKEMIAVGFQRSTWEPDYACSGYDLPRVTNEVGGCVSKISSSSVTSSSLYDRWITTIITYDSISGRLEIDYDGDGVIDFVGTVDSNHRFKPTRVSFNGFGWYTGHFMRIDSLKVESLQ